MWETSRPDVENSSCNFSRSKFTLSSLFVVYFFHDSCAKPVSWLISLCSRLFFVLVITSCLVLFLVILRECQMSCQLAYRKLLTHQKAIPHYEAEYCRLGIITIIGIISSLYMHFPFLFLLFLILSSVQVRGYHSGPELPPESVLFCKSAQPRREPIKSCSQGLPSVLKSPAQVVHGLH